MSEEMQQELAVIKHAVTTLLTESKWVRGAFQQLHEESKWVREEFKRVHERLDGVDKRLKDHDAHFYRLSVGYARVEGKIADAQENTEERLQIIQKGMTTTLAAFAGKVEAFERQLSVSNYVQMQHEDRLKALETRPKGP